MAINDIPEMPKPPPKGCWFTHLPYGSGNIFTDFAGTLINNLYNGPIDCDCHWRGTCMPGEPPLPPMDEFIQDDYINPGWEALPVVPVNKSIPNAHTWRPKWWRAHGPAGRKTFLEAFSPHNADGHWKRDETGPEPDHLKREPVLRGGDPPHKGLTMSDHKGYRASVIRAFRKLPAKKQLAVMAKWPDLKTHTEYIHWTNEVEFDPRPALAILLADPRGWAGRAVQAMDRRHAGLLLHCADAAVSSMLNKTMQEILDHAPGTDSSDPDRAMYESRKAMTTRRQEYYEVFKHYAVLWEHTTPAGLGRGDHGHETFSFEAQINIPEKPQNFTQEFQDVTVSSNDVCEAVNRGAISNVGTKGSFVADFDTIMESLNQHMKSAKSNTMMNTMNLPLTLEPMTGHLDWAPETLPKIFKESSHAVQLGMSYVSLSLWLGIGR
ncbi:hypothetical protein EDB81DRAFT_857905 [Dactylonectria macrodidyma]|uniref:Uncharacterized protein n=1 Tax=Dactylonectria macrodidyma TaxID=307937 RepID=A0A9P9EMY6_9HYPO|nr:hypothetical protein EDB81DRAFT_857905 [Dactylonectria macrodidyma]